jgi:hypothetical protein
MATITPTEAKFGNFKKTATWLAWTDADTCTAIESDGYTRAFVQLYGTFGSGTVVLQGSFDNTEWETIKDVGGAAISATADASFTFDPIAPYIRASGSGGTAESYDVAVTLA